MRHIPGPYVHRESGSFKGSCKTQWRMQYDTYQFNLEHILLFWIEKYLISSAYLRAPTLMWFYHLGSFTETTQKPRLGRTPLLFAFADVLYSECDLPLERCLKTNYRFSPSHPTHSQGFPKIYTDNIICTHRYIKMTFVMFTGSSQRNLTDIPALWVLKPHQATHPIFCHSCAWK